MRARRVKIFEEKVLDAGGEKRHNGLFRRVHNRLPIHIEPGIQHHLPASGVAHCDQQSVKIAIVFHAHRLQP